MPYSNRVHRVFRVYPHGYRVYPLPAKLKIIIPDPDPFPVIVG